MTVENVEKSDLELKITTLENEIMEKKKELVLLRKSLPDQAVENYTFTTPDGDKVTLSDLFNGKNELILVHNMGKSCSNCTLWADGFDGVVDHLENRAGFVVASPDSPDEQKEIIKERGWVFNMISTAGTPFKEDMGFENEKGLQPGVSIFQKDSEGKISHYTRAPFGPGDDFCAVWNLFDLLPSGSGNWEPKDNYID